MKYTQICLLFLMLVSYTSSGGQNKTNAYTSQGPNTITRNIIQDRKGNIWIAAFDGIFRYDGKSFINITSKVSSARFFSVLEDRKATYGSAPLVQVFIIMMGGPSFYNRR
jgi:ligand-binding sensor domain-containing protein